MRKTKQQQNRQLFLIYGIIYVFLVYLCIVFAPYWTGTLIDSLPRMAAMPKSAFWHLQKSPYTFSMILIVTVGAPRHPRHGRHSPNGWCP